MGNCSLSAAAHHPSIYSLLSSSFNYAVIQIAP